MSLGVVAIRVEDEGEDFFDLLPGRVDRMMVDVVDDITEHARDQIVFEAPGSIAGLVEMESARLVEQGRVEAQTGVTPAHDVEQRGKTFVQVGSDPADYPYFKHEGTGIYGQYGSPIVVPAPGFMQIDFPDGRVRTHVVRGQEPDPYVERAFEDTAGYVPVRLAAAELPSGGT